MKCDIIILKYGEVVMKGLNRSYFDSLILRRVKRLLEGCAGAFELHYAQSTLCVKGSEGADMDGAFERMKRVFGVASVCKALSCEKTLDAIKATVAANVDGLLGSARTFKCEAKRSDKRFPLTSPELSAELGALISDLRPDLRVDVNNPDVVVITEVRDCYAAVRGGCEKGAGGLPSGSAGRALLLLSGGIDSPVAGYLMARRGLTPDALYFDSPPYTGAQAEEKVVALAQKLCRYCGRIYLHEISLTEIQETLWSTCDRKLFTVLLRRFMMRLAEKLAEELRLSALITGESLGQVASQTLDALCMTNAVPKRLPVFRPCIGMDKEEIVRMARHIGTFETSSLPYPDCCTLFVPRHPNTRPTAGAIAAEEAKIDVEGLTERAYGTRRHRKVTDDI